MQLLPNEHGFDQPLQLLSDCHRRIERFLHMLEIVAEEAPEGWLPTQYETGLRAALDYFRDAAPLHTEDEERSLFPRIVQFQKASATLKRLEREHKQADQLHAVVEKLGHEWLTKGCLSAESRELFALSIVQLRTLYQEHIQIEDGELFPMADHLLDARALKDIGEEMALRRGLAPEEPGGSRRG